MAGMGELEPFLDVFLIPPFDPELLARMTVGFRVDRLVVRAGEDVELHAAVRNDGSATVHAMHIKIKQLTTWSARGHNALRNRTLASVVVPAAEIRIQRVPYQGTDSIAEAARRDVRGQLQAGTGTSYRISVPRSALLSTETAKVKVRHFLSLKLKTTAFKSLPEVWTVLHIRPPETAPEALAGPAGQRCTEVAPHNSTRLVEVRGGGDMPESVRQGMSAMGYRVTRPQQEHPAQ